MHWIALQPAPDGEFLADAHVAWVWWALQFTPLVARLEQALVLEVSTSERLFGGRAALLAQLLAPEWPITAVAYAQGASALVAYGRLQCGSALQDGEPGAIAPQDLPLHTLVAARAHLPTLARLGLSTWGQLRALPRGGLVRRFGAELLDALDCAYGQRAEVYPWLSLPEVFDAPLELVSSVDTAPALLFGARRLLAQLQVWLRARQRGVLALELSWELDARRSNALHVDAHHTGDGTGHLSLRTAQATQDMQHLARLLGEHLAQVSLPAPVLYLRLRSLQTQPLAGESMSLLPDDVRHGDSRHQLLERLSARLGSEQVRSATLLADHRPECMQSWQAAADVAASSHQTGATRERPGEAIRLHSTHGTQGVQYPSWLLATPVRLHVQQGLPQYHGPLTLLAGPQRLESGWLDDLEHCALRDYYVARSAVAGLVWVYRERLDGPPPTRSAWYLHGLFA